jgi:hypothetical protein
MVFINQFLVKAELANCSENLNMQGLLVFFSWLYYLFYFRNRPYSYNLNYELAELGFFESVVPELVVFRAQGSPDSCLSNQTRLISHRRYSPMPMSTLLEKRNLP